jgi:multidrug efflux system membrane fusion protein
MRALFSYGVAGVIVIGIAAWLGTGTLVIGGRGPGNGERPIISLVEENGGPITEALEESGMMAHPEHALDVDPHLTIAQRNEESTGADAPLRSVRTQTFTMQPMAVEVPLRGTTRAKFSVSVMPETQGVVRQVHVAKGDTVQPGDLLCTLEQGTRAAAVAQAESGLAQAQAGLASAEADLETNRSLRERGLAPENTGRALEVQFKAAQASVAAAESALENARAELARTEVRAEVAGVVQAPLASIGNMVGAGAPCATIVQLDPMLFTGNVPEARIGAAKLGLEATVTTVAGQTVEGKVSYIASTADPATRSFPVEIELPNPNREVLDGLTATAVVNLGTVPAHLLPQSVMTLNDDGELGVRSVENGVVEFHPITIVRDTREGIWVTGLPASIDVITVGQEFVAPGQKVDATNVPAGAEAPAAETASAESVAS